MPKITIEPNLYKRALDAAAKSGYSSVEEFLTHAIENELAKLREAEDAEQQVADQLRGLGYIE